jgi:hypothetical protein
MNIISDNLAAWLAATLLTLLTIFSDKIFERIRFSLNRADLRVKYFEDLAMDLSAYVFWVDVFHERYQKKWTDDPADLAKIIGELNTAMITLRSKEYVYRSWIKRYWGSVAVEQFVKLMSVVRSVDMATHAFNDAGHEDKKLSIMSSQLDALRQSVDHWLSQMNA